MSPHVIFRAAALLVATATLLSACGVDGPPERPTEKTFQQQGRVSISGDARIGVSAEL